MAKIEIPEGLKGKELTDFLTSNKSALIAQKKSMLKTSDCIATKSAVFAKNTAEKASQLPNEDATSVLVKVVANACNFMDSDFDVLIANSAKRTIGERKGLIPHLHDHIHQVGAQIGDVEDIYLADISLRDLGINKSGTTQCIIFETSVQKSYNEKVFNLYKSGRVVQHSIGLQYVNLEIAINDPDSEKEYELWLKHYNEIINKEAADEAGFFFVVREIKLLENSAVLFGANSLTPTLQVGKSADIPAPTEEVLQESQQFDAIKAIREIKFFN